MAGGQFAATGVSLEVDSRSLEFVYSRFASARPPDLMPLELLVLHGCSSSIGGTKVRLALQEVDSRYQSLIRGVTDGFVASEFDSWPWTPLPGAGASPELYQTVILGSWSAGSGSGGSEERSALESIESATKRSLVLLFPQLMLLFSYMVFSLFLRDVLEGGSFQFCFDCI